MLRLTWYVNRKGSGSDVTVEIGLVSDLRSRAPRRLFVCFFFPVALQGVVLEGSLSAVAMSSQGARAERSPVGPSSVFGGIFFFLRREETAGF